jgi:tRNA pseudouridine55 synthase
MDFEQGEVLLLNKPLNWTSFDVVNKIRYALRKKYGPKIKVGHAGTLDPLATGLLILCTGKMTRQLESFTGMDKEYTGSFLVGATTPTYDSEMPPDATYPINHITDDLIKKTATIFEGHIEQVPPIYSAIKTDGTAAYLKARKGKEVTMQPRKVTIRQFEITHVDLPLVDFRVVCSKGTYIRSLAYDFGRALNSGAYLAALCRTKIGNFNLKDAWEIDALVKQISGMPDARPG